MMSTLSILVFMLVQGHVVCDSELFPVSIFEVDSVEHQPIDPQKDDEIEPLQGINVTERFEDPEVTEDDIAWMDEIINNYGFKKHPVAAMWKEQPSFEDDLGTENFKTAAEKAEQFFLKFSKNRGKSPWELLQKVTKNQNYKLLKITAARYLLVTDILWRVSRKKLTACKEKRNSYTDIPQSWEIPKHGVCFPKPYGSPTYKSDYDVGLIGKDSGTVTQKFNEYFEENFKIPSELVFDTNVYAYTLEFAMPKMFPNLPRSFISDLHNLEQMGRYKMQELASAYYKVFKYNEGSFKVMKKGAIDEIKDKKAKKLLLYWLEEFEKMNTQVDLRQMDTKLVDFRVAHNKKYQEYLRSMSQGKTGSYHITSTDYLAKALLYAAQAYHTRGAMRHVVQGLQMSAIPTCQYYTPLSTYDLWVSMIENWGEANKEYKHCKYISIAECLMKMSKYLSRMFNAMRVIRRSRLPKIDREGLLDFGTTDDPEFVTDLLLRYKKSGKKLSPAAYNFVRFFLDKFKCRISSHVHSNFLLLLNCLETIQNEVNAYNKKLAANVNKAEGMKLFEPPFITIFRRKGGNVETH